MNQKTLNDAGRPRRFSSATTLALRVTAKHNLESCGEEQYMQTTVKFVNRHETDVLMRDGGCILLGEDGIEVGSATGLVS